MPSQTPRTGPWVVCRLAAGAPRVLEPGVPTKHACHAHGFRSASYGMPGPKGHPPRRGRHGPEKSGDTKEENRTPRGRRGPQETRELGEPDTETADSLRSLKKVTQHKQQDMKQNNIKTRRQDTNIKKKKKKTEKKLRNSYVTAGISKIQENEGPEGQG